MSTKDSVQINNMPSLLPEQKEKYILDNTERWIEEGKRFESMRKIMKLSRIEVAKQVGCSVGPITRFEHGQTVSRRKMLMASYYTALKMFFLYRQVKLAEGVMPPKNTISPA